MIVTCSCKQMNRVADTLAPGSTVRCGKCRKDLTVQVRSRQIQDTTRCVRESQQDEKFDFLAGFARALGMDL